MNANVKITLSILVLLAACTSVGAGPYTEAGIAGYIDEDARPADPNTNPNAVVNPIFKGWATGYVNYLPADSGDDFFWDFTGEPNEPARAIGPASGRYDDTVSLGELDEDEILLDDSPGEITLTFTEPGIIQNNSGYDFAVFENGFSSAQTTPGGSIAGKMFCEFAFVEVSSDGVHFARFPSVSLNPGPPQAYGTLDFTNVFNLAGKHPNSNANCYGTPFDLDDLTDHPLVTAGLVNLNNIRYVKLVDIPGCGNSVPPAPGWDDDATQFIDPDTWPNWDIYAAAHPIIDAWPTYGTGGFDLDAVGVLKPQQFPADINLDGRVDLADLIALRYAWLSHFGDENWVGRCDLASPKNLIIDIEDLAEFCDQWLEQELWRQ